MDNFYYALIYDVLCVNRPHEVKVTELNRYKVKIVQLHSDRVKWVLLETDETDENEGENPTFFHDLRIPKRRTARVIQRIQDEHGRDQSSPKGISRHISDRSMNI